MDKQFKAIRINNYLYLFIVIGYSSYDVDKFQNNIHARFEDMIVKKTGRTTKEFSYWVMELLNINEETINDSIFEYAYDYFKSN